MPPDRQAAALPQPCVVGGRVRFPALLLRDVMATIGVALERQSRIPEQWWEIGCSVLHRPGWSGQSVHHTDAGRQSRSSPAEGRHPSLSPAAHAAQSPGRSSWWSLGRCCVLQTNPTQSHRGGRLLHRRTGHDRSTLPSHFVPAYGHKLANVHATRPVRAPTPSRLVPSIRGSAASALDAAPPGFHRSAAAG